MRKQCCSLPFVRAVQQLYLNQRIGPCTTCGNKCGLMLLSGNHFAEAVTCC